MGGGGHLNCTLKGASVFFSSQMMHCIWNGISYVYSILLFVICLTALLYFRISIHQSGAQLQRSPSPLSSLAKEVNNEK